MPRRTKTIIFAIILPSILCAGLIASLIWAFSATARAEDYQNAAEATYRRAYSDLVTELNDMEVTLSKLQVAGTRNQCVKLLNDLWQSGGTCIGLLSQIPASHVDTYEMNRFILRISDYANSLSASIMRGGVLKEDDMKQLLSLRESCNLLAADISSRYSEQRYTTELLDTEGYYTTAADEYKTDATRMQYPSLIYDGPFSESTEKAQPEGITGGQCDVNAATECARRFIPEGATISFSTESQGEIPAYDFNGTTADGRSFDVSVSKQGANLVWYLCQCTCPENENGKPDEIEQRQLEQTALMYLKDRGYYEMKSTYMQYYNGFALINFAASQDGIIIYNDLIKVWVDRQTREVIGVDTVNYLYSHVKRDFPKTELSEDDARAYLSENLKVDTARLAYIPITPETEALCYEFTGTCNNETYIVYINATNGYEEQIFKIINAADGTMVM